MAKQLVKQKTRTVSVDHVLSRVFTNAGLVSARCNVDSNNVKKSCAHSAL